MADTPSGPFEQKLARLEAIVKELEGGNVELDRIVTLFDEGNKLSHECEGLLKASQDRIARVAGEGKQAGASPSDDIPF